VLVPSLAVSTLDRDNIGEDAVMKKIMLNMPPFCRGEKFGINFCKPLISNNRHQRRCQKPILEAALFLPESQGGMGLGGERSGASLWAGDAGACVAPCAHRERMPDEEKDWEGAVEKKLCRVRPLFAIHLPAYYLSHIFTLHVCESRMPTFQSAGFGDANFGEGLMYRETRRQLGNGRLSG